ncbi:MAG: SDR family NAD(P)-dependent oxidoreductase, partial [Calditrichales bacterium]
MDLGLKGKVAVITGGSKGIGKGIAKALASEGCRVVICARGQEALEAAGKELKNSGAEVLALPLDVTRKADVVRLREETLKTFGQVDILVNNVGGNKRGKFADTTDQDWRDIIDLNLLSHAEVSRAIIPEMQKQGSGTIVFISSIFGRESGGPTLSIYNATKSALISM